MKPLLKTYTGVLELQKPDKEMELSFNSSAIELMTDFRKTRPLIIDASVSAVDAERMMKHSHVRSKLVIDNHGLFQGIVSLRDLNNQEMLKKLYKGISRDDLSIKDFMIPKDKLKFIEFNSLERLSIKQLIQVLGGYKNQHCAVIEDGSVRGIISASDIIRKLRLPLSLDTESEFSSVFKFSV